MRLFLFELKKLWSEKEFLLYFALLICVNIFLLWFYSQPDANSAPPSSYYHLTKNLSRMNEVEKIEYINSEYDKISAIVKIDSLVKSYGSNSKRFKELVSTEYKDIFERYKTVYSSGEYLKYTDSLYTEYYFLQNISEEISQVAAYESFLDEIQHKAEQLSKISIFNKDGSYDMLNIQATSKAYKDISGIEINYYPQNGIVTAINFTYSDVILIFGMILLASFIVRDEKDNGMLYLIRTTAGGKWNTGAAKMFAMSTSLLIMVAALYIVNLLYCNFTYGLGDLSRTIQSIPYLMRSTMQINVLEYILLFIFTKWVAAFICGTWILFAMLIAKNVFTGYVLSLVMPVTQLLIRNAIPATSKFNAIKYSNLVSFLTTNEILGSYRNIYWFNKPVRLFWVEIIAALIFSIIFSSLFLVTFKIAQLSKYESKRISLSFKRKVKPTTVTRQEWYKLLVMNGGIFILTLFCAFQIYTAYTAENYITAEEMFYSYYMQELTGPYNTDAYEFIKSESEKFKPIYEAQRLLKNKLITSEEYNMILSANYGLNMEYGIFQKVLRKINTLSEKPGSQLIYETGYNKLFDFNNYLDLKDYMLIVLMVCVFFAGFFNIEKSTGMYKVIKATPLGMEYTAQTKIKVTFLSCIILTVVSILPRLWQIGTGYGYKGLLVPAISIDNLQELPSFIPVIAIIVFMLIVRLVITFALSMIVLTISQKTNNFLSAVMFSLLLLEFPALLYYLKVDWVKWLTLYIPFHIVGNLPDNLMTFVSLLYLGLLTIIINKTYRFLINEYSVIN